MYMCKNAMLNVVLQNTIAVRLVVNRLLGGLAGFSFLCTTYACTDFFGSSLSMYWLQKNA